MRISDRLMRSSSCSSGVSFTEEQADIRAQAIRAMMSSFMIYPFF